LVCSLVEASSYRVDSVVFDAEKLLMSNSCEIKWAIDNNSLKNKNNFIKNAFKQRASFFSFREGLVSHCPSGHSLNPPLATARARQFWMLK